MNRERIRKAIAVMERAENLNMAYFQGHNGDISKSIEELHACGNTACFAGYIAISEEFKADGGGQVGALPTFNDCNADIAIAEWLGIDLSDAWALVFGNLEKVTENHDLYSLFYGKSWSEVEPADVIAKLEKILARDDS